MLLFTLFSDLLTSLPNLAITNYLKTYVKSFHLVLGTQTRLWKLGYYLCPLQLVIMAIMTIKKGKISPKEVTKNINFLKWPIRICYGHESNWILQNFRLVYLIQTLLHWHSLLLKNFLLALQMQSSKFIIPKRSQLNRY